MIQGETLMAEYDELMKRKDRLVKECKATLFSELQDSIKELEGGEHSTIALCEIINRKKIIKLIQSKKELSVDGLIKLLQKYGKRHQAGE